MTEEEVDRGVLSLPMETARDHTLCFVRNIVDINYEHDKLYRFLEYDRVDSMCLYYYLCVVVIHPHSLSSKIREFFEAATAL